MVEFALILPLLLFLVFGIIEFGRGYNVKVQLTASVREGARALALGGSPAVAQQAVRDAAPGLNPALADGDIGVTFTDVDNIPMLITSCPAGGAPGNAIIKAIVTVNYNLNSLTPLVPSGSININVKGVMRCES